MLDEGLGILLTFDKNLQHQQNFQKHLITVFVLSAKNNTYKVLSPLMPKIQHYLQQDTLPVGAIIIQEKT